MVPILEFHESFAANLKKKAKRLDGNCQPDTLVQKTHLRIIKNTHVFNWAAVKIVLRKEYFENGACQWMTSDGSWKEVK